MFGFGNPNQSVLVPTLIPIPSKIENKELTSKKRIMSRGIRKDGAS